LPIIKPAGTAGRARLLADDGPDRVPAAGSDACYQAALRLLGYRDRTEAELRQRLSRKGFTEAEIDIVAERLKASGLINDAAFARAWSDHRAAGSPRSAYLVKRELLTKGIDPATAEEAAGTVEDSEAAYAAVLPRLNRLKALPLEETRHKLADFLRRRGFSWHIVEGTLRRLAEENLLVEANTD